MTLPSDLLLLYDRLQLIEKKTTIFNKHPLAKYNIVHNGYIVIKFYLDIDSFDNKFSVIFKSSGDNMFSEIFKRPGDNMFSEIFKRPGDNMFSEIFMRPGDNMFSEIFKRQGDNMFSEIFKRPGDNKFSEIFKRPGDNMFSEILKRPGSSSILLNVYLQRLRTLARFIILLKAENTFFV